MQRSEVMAGEKEERGQQRVCACAREQHESVEEHQRARCEADDKEENHGRETCDSRYVTVRR